MNTNTELTEKELSLLEAGDGSESTSEDCRRAARDSAKRWWLQNSWSTENESTSVNFNKVFNVTTEW